MNHLSTQNNLSLSYGPISLQASGDVALTIGGAIAASMLIYAVLKAIN